MQIMDTEQKKRPTSPSKKTARKSFIGPFNPGFLDKLPHTVLLPDRRKQEKDTTKGNKQGTNSKVDKNQETTQTTHGEPSKESNKRKCDTSSTVNIINKGAISINPADTASTVSKETVSQLKSSDIDKENESKLSNSAYVNSKSFNPFKKLKVGAKIPRGDLGKNSIDKVENGQIDNTGSRIDKDNRNSVKKALVVLSKTKQLAGNKGNSQKRKSPEKDLVNKEGDLCHISKTKKVCFTEDVRSNVKPKEKYKFQSGEKLKPKCTGSSNLDKVSSKRAESVRDNKDQPNLKYGKDSERRRDKHSGVKSGKSSSHESNKSENSHKSKESHAAKVDTGKRKRLVSDTVRRSESDSSSSDRVEKRKKPSDTVANNHRHVALVIGTSLKKGDGSSNCTSLKKGDISNNYQQSEHKKYTSKSDQVKSSINTDKNRKEKGLYKSGIEHPIHGSDKFDKRKDTSNHSVSSNSQKEKREDWSKSKKEMVSESSKGKDMSESEKSSSDELKKKRRHKSDSCKMSSRHLDKFSESSSKDKDKFKQREKDKRKDHHTLSAPEKCDATEHAKVLERKGESVVYTSHKDQTNTAGHLHRTESQLNNSTDTDKPCVTKKAKNALAQEGLHSGKVKDHRSNSVGEHVKYSKEEKKAKDYYRRSKSVDSLGLSSSSFQENLKLIEKDPKGVVKEHISKEIKHLGSDDVRSSQVCKLQVDHSLTGVSNIDLSKLNNVEASYSVFPTRLPPNSTDLSDLSNIDSKSEVNKWETQPVSNQNESASTQKKPVPTEKEPVSTQKDSVPHQKKPVSAQNDPVPHQKKPVSAQKDSVPHQKKFVSAQKDSVSVQKETKIVQGNIKSDLRSKLLKQYASFCRLQKPPKKAKSFTYTKDIPEMLNLFEESFEESFPSSPTDRLFIATDDNESSITDGKVSEAELAAEDSDSTLPADDDDDDGVETSNNLEMAIGLSKEVSSDQVPVPAQRESVPAQNDSVSAQKDSVPNQKESFPTQKNSVSAQNEIAATEKSLATQKDPVSTQIESLSIQKDSVPAQKEPVSAQNDIVSAQKDFESAQNEFVSTHNDSVPAQKDSVSTQRDSVPAQKESLPTQGAHLQYNSLSLFDKLLQEGFPDEYAKQRAGRTCAQPSCAQGGDASAGQRSPQTSCAQERDVSAGQQSPQISRTQTGDVCAGQQCPDISLAQEGDVRAGQQSPRTSRAQEGDVRAGQQSSPTSRTQEGDVCAGQQSLDLSRAQEGDVCAGQQSLDISRDQEEDVRAGQQSPQTSHAQEGDVRAGQQSPQTSHAQEGDVRAGQQSPQTSHAQEGDVRAGQQSPQTSHAQEGDVRAGQQSPQTSRAQERNVCAGQQSLQTSLEQEGDVLAALPSPDGTLNTTANEQVPVALSVNNSGYSRQIGEQNSVLSYRPSDISTDTTSGTLLNIKTEPGLDGSSPTCLRNDGPTFSTPRIDRISINEDHRNVLTSQASATSSNQITTSVNEEHLRNVLTGKNSKSVKINESYGSQAKAASSSNEMSTCGKDTVAQPMLSSLSVSTRPSVFPTTRNQKVVPTRSSRGNKNPNADIIPSNVDMSRLHPGSNSASVMSTQFNGSKEYRNRLCREKKLPIPIQIYHQKRTTCGSMVETNGNLYPQLFYGLGNKCVCCFVCSEWMSALDFMVHHDNLPSYVEVNHAESLATYQIQFRGELDKNQRLLWNQFCRDLAKFKRWNNSEGPQSNPTSMDRAFERSQSMESSSIYGRASFGQPKDTHQASVSGFSSSPPNRNVYDPSLSRSGWSQPRTNPHQEELYMARNPNILSRPMQDLERSVVHLTHDIPRNYEQALTVVQNKSTDFQRNPSPPKKQGACLLDRAPVNYNHARPFVPQHSVSNQSPVQDQHHSVFGQLAVGDHVSSHPAIRDHPHVSRQSPIRDPHHRALGQLDIPDLVQDPYNRVSDRSAVQDYHHAAPTLSHAVPYLQHHVSSQSPRHDPLHGVSSQSTICDPNDRFSPESDSEIVPSANPSFASPYHLKSMATLDLLTLSQKCHSRVLKRLLSERDNHSEEIKRLKVQLNCEIQGRKELQTTVSTLLSEVDKLKAFISVSQLGETNLPLSQK